MGAYEDLYNSEKIEKRLANESKYETGPATLAIKVKEMMRTGEKWPEEAKKKGVAKLWADLWTSRKEKEAERQRKKWKEEKKNDAFEQAVYQRYFSEIASNLRKERTEPMPKPKLTSQDEKWLASEMYAQMTEEKRTRILEEKFAENPELLDFNRFKNYSASFYELYLRETMKEKAARMPFDEVETFVKSKLAPDEIQWGVENHIRQQDEAFYLTDPANREKLAKIRFAYIAEQEQDKARKKKRKANVRKAKEMSFALETAMENQNPQTDKLLQEEPSIVAFNAAIRNKLNKTAPEIFINLAENAAGSKRDGAAHYAFKKVVEHTDMCIKYPRHFFNLANKALASDEIGIAGFICAKTFDNPAMKPLLQKEPEEAWALCTAAITRLPDGSGALRKFSAYKQKFEYMSLDRVSMVKSICKVIEHNPAKRAFLMADAMDMYREGAPQAKEVEKAFGEWADTRKRTVRDEISFQKDMQKASEILAWRKVNRDYRKDVLENKSAREAARRQEEEPQKKQSEEKGRQIASVGSYMLYKKDRPY